MIIVTGGAGMIGSNIIKALNALGQTNILVVDNLKNGLKFENLVDLDIVDFLDKEEFIKLITSDKKIGSIKTIFHEGACSETTEWNGKYMMENNYQYSKHLLNFCINYKIPFLYASSAAIYGIRNENFIEERQYEKPLNVYGYSKMLFDHYVRQVLPAAVSPICGFRYFNIYGPGEDHKGSMASVIFNFNSQISKGKNIKLFEGSNNFSRDFTHVTDVVAMNLWCWENNISGIYNCGTGHATSFQEIANIVLKYHQEYQIEYILFPETLKGRYQRFTQANLNNLHVAGYNKPFKTVNEGIIEYLTWLNCIKQKKQN